MIRIDITLWTTRRSPPTSGIGYAARQMYTYEGEPGTGSWSRPWGQAPAVPFNRAIKTWMELWFMRLLLLTTQLTWITCRLSCRYSWYTQLNVPPQLNNDPQYVLPFSLFFYFLFTIQRTHRIEKSDPKQWKVPRGRLRYCCTDRFPI